MPHHEPSSTAPTATGQSAVQPLDRAEVNDHLSALAAEAGIHPDADFFEDPLNDLTHVVADALDAARGVPTGAGEPAQRTLASLLSPWDVETLLRTAVEVFEADGDLSNLSGRQVEALETARAQRHALLGEDEALDEDLFSRSGPGDDVAGPTVERAPGPVDGPCAHPQTTAAPEDQAHQRECSTCGAHLHLSAAEALRLAVRDDGAFYVTTEDGQTTFAGPYLDQIDADTAAEQIENEKHVRTDIRFECR